MKIPFTKAHGAKNDFLLTWRQDAPEGDRAAMARAICDRHTGVGADGWLLVEKYQETSEADGAIQLYNSDGSTAELSGNGTRCAAAFLVRSGSDRPRPVPSWFASVPAPASNTCVFCGATASPSSSK